MNSPSDQHFTVVMPAVLRERLTRWLKRQHMQMLDTSPEHDATRFQVVTPSSAARR